MFTCKIENTKNQLLTLTQNESNFQVINIDGLNPPKAQINRSKTAGLDGSRFNSAFLEERNIVLTIKLRGNIESNRINLYSFFRSKEWCKFYYSNGLRNVFIEGYCESVEVSPFSSNEIMQVSIICPLPYFKAMDEIISDISKSLAAFSFPFSIGSSGIVFSTLNSSRVTNVYNDSDMETGVMIEITFESAVNKVQISNLTTGESFVINRSFIDGDKLVIDTYKGEKSVKLIRNAVATNVFASITRASSFFQLSIGDNLFTYAADNGASDDSVFIQFKYHTLYGGV